MKTYSKLKQFSLNSIVVLIVFIMLLVFSEDNTVNFNANALRIISPQGYAFFTRNPKEPQLFIYKMDNNNKIVENLSQNSSSMDMLFGLSRKNRRISMEMNEIFPKLIRWEDYDGIDDINKVKPDTILFKSKDSRKVTGTFLIIKEKRIPWAWASNMKKPKRKFKLVYLK